MNTLADLPSRVDDAWFFSFSFSFLGGRERFDKKVASAGTSAGPKTTVEGDEGAEDEEEAKDEEETEGDTGESDDAPGAVHPLPAAVENLTATRSGDKVELSWKEVEGATYQVFRGTACDSLFALGGNVKDTRFEEIDPDATVNYHYAVRAVIDGAVGNISTCVEAPPP